MQHTMIASYIAILLGYITMDDKVIQIVILTIIYICKIIV